MVPMPPRDADRRTLLHATVSQYLKTNKAECTKNNGMEIAHGATWMPAIGGPGMMGLVSAHGYLRVPGTGQ